VPQATTLPHAPFIIYYYYYLLTAIGHKPGGSVYKRDIQSTRNIAHTSHGKNDTYISRISQIIGLLNSIYFLFPNFRGVNDLLHDEKVHNC
jgi:hypothetical protein